jgi:hypothetical protein
MTDDDATMLNEERFSYSQNIYEIDFHEILTVIINAYKLLVEENVQVENKENHIRDILVEKYLNDNVKRKQLGIEHVIFNREAPENMGKGFVDIKVQTMISLNEPQAYYVFECKRLDGNKGLNEKYIKEGIMRFVSEKYSSYYGLNGMLGFEIKNFNTPDNIEEINLLVSSKYPEAAFIEKISPVAIIENFQFCFISRHKTVSFSQVKLYHLMLDFSHIVTPQQ